MTYKPEGNALDDQSRVWPRHLGLGQDEVSRLEQRSDFLNSTLRSYIEAMASQLSPVAEFPDREPLILSGIEAIETEQPMPLRRCRC
jgi:hypothetical protein